MDCHRAIRCCLAWCSSSVLGISRALCNVSLDCRPSWHFLTSCSYKPCLLRHLHPWSFEVTSQLMLASALPIAVLPKSHEPQHAPALLNIGRPLPAGVRRPVAPGHPQLQAGRGVTAGLHCYLWRVSALSCSSPPCAWQASAVAGPTASLSGAGWALQREAVKSHCTNG